MKRKRSNVPWGQSGTGSRALWTKRRRVRGTAYAQASRALRLIRKFKKEEEEKYIDTSPSLNIPFAADAWQFFLLNPLTQGTTAITRIGSKVTFKSLIARLNINRDTAETGGFAFRVVILYDRKPAGAAPSATTIFASDFWGAPLNRANAGRFAILYDRVINISSVVFQYNWKIYLDLRRVSKGDYGLGNAGTIADISKGSIYLCGIGNGVEVADCNCSGRSRIAYTDA